MICPGLQPLLRFGCLSSSLNSHGRHRRSHGCGVVKPTVKQALGVPPGTGTLCCACPAVHPLHPDPSWPLCAPAPSSGITQTIPGRARWSLELSRALIHDLILRRAITQSPVLFLAAKCRREMGLCSLIVAVPQSEAWHWHLQPRNVTLIRLGSCSGLLSVEHEPAASGQAGCRLVFLARSGEDLFPCLSCHLPKMFCCGVAIGGII